MGYFHRICKVKCGNCGSQMAWSLKPTARLPSVAKCKCGASNIVRDRPPKLDVPLVMYLGHEKNRQLKVYAVPPESPTSQSDAWAQPYSIRSFVHQASRQLDGCCYRSSRRGDVLGEPVFSDICCDPDENVFQDDHPCHFVAGFTLGDVSCPLWQKVCAICQTESERRFLHVYLNLVKDRHFPMLLPQARLGIAERRRPDFVAFVPLQELKYKPIAVELDHNHRPEQASGDDLRDMDLAGMGFHVIRVKPPDGKTIGELKNLVETIENQMTRADSDPWSVAVELEVAETRLNPIDDFPF